MRPAESGPSIEEAGEIAYFAIVPAAHRLSALAFKAFEKRREETVRVGGLGEEELLTRSQRRILGLLHALIGPRHLRHAVFMTFPPKVYAFRRMREGVHGKKPKKGRNAVGCVVEGLLEGRNGRYRRENENNRRLRGPAAPFGPPVSAGSGTPRP